MPIRNRLYAAEVITSIISDRFNVTDLRILSTKHNSACTICGLLKRPLCPLYPDQYIHVSIDPDILSKMSDRPSYTKTSEGVLAIDLVQNVDIENIQIDDTVSVGCFCYDINNPMLNELLKKSNSVTIAIDVDDPDKYIAQITIYENRVKVTTFQELTLDLKIHILFSTYSYSIQS